MSRAAARHRSGARKAPRVRPRYGRIAAFVSAVLVTVLAVAGGAGLLPSETSGSTAAAAPRRAVLAGASVSPEPGLLTPEASSTPSAPITPSRAPDSGHSDPTADPSALPVDSGEGRRVVFDQSSQRVWLVGSNGRMLRNYLVSGSLTDNLQPGSYEVYSRSRWAVGVDDSGVMQYFVRFAHGRRAAIGFHSIPTKDGRPLQSRAELGTPQSHGCIRQAMPDAVAMWDFASVGTRVIVTA